MEVKKLAELRKIIPDIANINGEPWFPVVALVGYFYEGASDARQAWKNIKRRLKNEGSQLVFLVHQLKRVAADGKERLTDYANLETCFLIVQFIDGEKSMPVKEFLAKCGAERTQESSWGASMINQRMLEAGALDEPPTPDRWIDTVGVASATQPTGEIIGWAGGDSQMPDWYKNLPKPPQSDEELKAALRTADIKRATEDLRANGFPGHLK